VHRGATWGRVDSGYLFACATAYLAFTGLTWRYTADDAWISVRYAENLANGHGFAWNPGGPRVEGFSNPLLVLIEALAHVLGIPAIGTARALGVACGLALLVVLATLGRRAVGVAASRVGLVLVALYPPIAFWTAGGLETLPVALALTAAVLLLCDRDRSARRTLAAGALLAVLPWLRPEGIVVALLVGVAAEAPALRSPPRRAAAVRLARLLALPVASTVALEAARLALFDHLMPNPVLYKQGTGQPFDVLGRFFAQGAPVLLLGVIGVLIARGRVRLLAVPAAVYLVGAINALNQVNAFGRFLLPTWPQWALLAGIAVAAAGRRVGRAGLPATVAATAAVLVLTVFVLPGRVASTRAQSTRYEACYIKARWDAARWLRRHTPETTTFSISDAGLVPARAGGRTAIDQLMLNEPEIQHSGYLLVRKRVPYVLGRKPDVIVLASKRPDEFFGKYPTDRLLGRVHAANGFVKRHVATGEPGCNYNLFIYVRRGVRHGERVRPRGSPLANHAPHAPRPEQVAAPIAIGQTRQRGR
jgi:arabinofuranosyltransferase